MSVKRYGLYVAYAPLTDFRKDGLGRYLGGFLKAATQRKDVRWTVLCASWSHQALRDLCESEGIDPAGFDLLSPSGSPAALRIYQWYLARWKRPRKGGLWKWIGERLQAAAKAHRSQLERRVATVRSHAALGVLLLYISLLSVVVGVWSGLLFLERFGRRILRWSQRQFQRLRSAAQAPALQLVDDDLKENLLTRRLYRFMMTRELELMRGLADSAGDVRAWYSPNAFHPEFNEIKAPRLVCVPDSVFTEFPVGFAKAGGKGAEDDFNELDKTIRTAKYIVTYSDTVKWDTLVARYGVAPESIVVIPHAAIDLSARVKVTGFPDSEAVGRNYTEWLLHQALSKSTNHAYGSSITHLALKYFFYASQLRPNKNMLTLLRAYEHLLRKKWLGYKLLLTGNPEDLPEVAAFVRRQRLSNDVLFMRGLTVSQLAACYRLAAVAVNPSLSEGGCPFTFTEALSVDTPVVMARIRVTQELLNDPAAQELMLFDAYDWKDMAQRMEWAAAHRAELLAIQKPIYEHLSKRTWGRVLDEHISILDRL